MTASPRNQHTYAISKTAKYFNIAFYTQGRPKTDFKMLFKSGKGIVYFKYSFIFLQRLIKFKKTPIKIIYE